MKINIKNLAVIFGSLTILTACNSGGSSRGNTGPTPSPTPPKPGITYSLTISPSPASMGYTQESTTLTLGVESFIDDNNIEVSITSPNQNIIKLNTMSCILSKNNPTCLINVVNSFNPMGGSAVITASANSYKSANTIITIQDIPTLYTWVGGESTPNQEGKYGTKGVASLNNYPGARTSPVSWTDLSGNLWLFGGVNSNNQMLNDLWKYNITTNEWTWVSGESFANQRGKYGIKGQPNVNNEPGARYLNSAWSDESGNFWLYGGRGWPAAGGGDLGDLWKYNPNTNEWTWISGESLGDQPAIYGTKNVPSLDNQPGSRLGSLNWRDKFGNLWLFSGSSNKNDLWRYNPNTNEWTWVNGESYASTPTPATYGIKGSSSPTTNPGARFASTEWSDSTGNLWLLGGTMDVSRFMNDLWKYNPNTNEWTWMGGESIPSQPGIYGIKGITNPSNMLGSRASSVVWHIQNSDSIWIFGGYGYDQNQNLGSLNDIWEFNPNTNEWTWVGGDSITNQSGVYGTIGTPSASNIPSPRINAVNWNDNQGNLWLFGGSSFNSGSGNKLNDLWKITPGVF